MKAKDIRELTEKEVVARVKEEEEHYWKMKMNNSISEIEAPSKIRHTRRLVARLKTLLVERQNANNSSEE